MVDQEGGRELEPSGLHRWGRPDAARSVAVGTVAAVRVPASTANLGPGFDCYGLALGLYDEIRVEVLAEGLDVQVAGAGANQVPLDATHLVIKALDAGLRAAGVTLPGVSLSCQNRIPHSRGLGSSAAAVVGGIAAANVLAGGVLSAADMVQLASEFEGHPDNAAASVLGGAVISWTETHADSADVRYRAASLRVAEALGVTVLIPPTESSTSITRGLLPAQVPHADAVFNVARASLLPVALAGRFDLLLVATEDRLHQGYRASALAETSRWIAELRARGVAATVSGAGPSVLALSEGEIPADIVAAVRAAGWQVERLPVAGPVEAWLEG